MRMFFFFVLTEVLTHKRVTREKEYEIFETERCGGRTPDK